MFMGEAIGLAASGYNFGKPGRPARSWRIYPNPTSVIGETLAQAPKLQS